MHRSVLQSKVYIKYAEANTVEVISMEEMDRALREKSRLVRTYKASDAYGDEVHFLAEFPGLTVKQLERLSNSGATDYMSGNRIPYTAIVDPHTLRELDHVLGVVTPKELIARIQVQRAALESRHGAGIERKLWRRVAGAQVEIDLLLGEGKLESALAVHRDLAKRTIQSPEAIRRRVRISLDVILDDAAKRLDVLEQRLGTGDADKMRAASEELRTLSRALAGTRLSRRAAALHERTKSKPD